MSPRRIAGRPNGRRIAWTAAPSLAAALVAAACGTALPSSPPPDGSPAASGPPAASGSGDAAATPRPTGWPGNAVLGIEALGAADGPITAALNDLGRGIADEDLALMRRAADGLAGLGVLLPNLERIRIFEPMVPFADRYEAAIEAIVAAAEALRSAIDAGDAARITSSTQQLVESLELYTGVQPELAQWVNESIEQRRLLLR
jgi:hypothetical protein